MLVAVGPVFSRRTGCALLFGVDISISMVEMFDHFELSAEYIVPPLVAEAEHIPFADGYFNNLACLAVCLMQLSRTSRLLSFCAC